MVGINGINDIDDMGGAVDMERSGGLPQGCLLAVERINVKRDRLVILVRCRGERYVSPHVAARAVEAFPSLPYHACLNDEGPTFGDVMGHTSAPHFLEHLVIDLQVRAGQPGGAYVGTTEWLDEKAGLARVEVGYKDDMVALGALNQAVRFLNETMAASGGSEGAVPR